MTIDYIAQTGMSPYDFLEFECFASKVEHEGFDYAAENYAPEFEAPTLQAVADDYSSLRALYGKHLPMVEAWYEQVGWEKACDLHNAHVDESRKRADDGCLWGIRCTDGYVITNQSEQNRDGFVRYLKRNAGEGRRVPAAPCCTALFRAASGPSLHCPPNPGRGPPPLVAAQAPFRDGDHPPIHPDIPPAAPLERLMPRLVSPNACRWCGMDEPEHMQRWKPPAGWHTWEPPTQEQIKARMQDRRNAQKGV